MQKQIDTLMQREMSRKEFIATLGFGAATIMGAGSLLKFLGIQKSTQTKASNGYGNSSYGN